ncbi:MAG: NADPH:quinone oxidoreductase family protein [Solirubrobacteraceae bacterium]
MKALQLQSFGGPGALELVDLDVPEAGDGMVAVDVHAAGAGFVDVLMSRGEYQIVPPLPFVPGIEFAGVVRTAPAGSGFEPGQRVAASSLGGAFAEVALAPAILTFPLPERMSFEQGAALVVNYQTAHLGLVRRGRLAEGETVLIHGAAGGVGTAAIQVARALGGRTIAVATGAAKLDAARAAGADEAVDAAGDWVAAVRELTGGRGADVVVDPVGGERFALSLKCLAPEGRLLVIGFASGEIPEVKVNRLLLRHHDVVGVNWGGFVPVDPSVVATAAADLDRWFAAGLIDPPIGARYPLAQGAEALRDLEARRSTGKPVIAVR